jgi:hypothetical protein
MKNKFFLGLSFVYLLAILYVSGCATSPSMVSQKPSTATNGNQAASAERYLANDRRFDGIWELPGVARFVFNADFYTLYDIDGDMIAAGLFVFTDSMLFGHIKPNVYFNMGYSITEEKLTVRSVLGLPISFFGDWVKIDTPKLEVSNLLVGTWKSDSLSRNLFIYQFYPDGTGIGNEYPRNYQSFTGGFLLNSSEFEYDITKPTFVEYGEDKNSEWSANISYRVNRDELVFIGYFSSGEDRNLILKRQ